MVSILHSREGVKQGGPLVMIVYGIGILPLVNNMKQAILDVTQPWYADNTRALSTSVRLENCFNLLTRHGLVRGYHPEPSKSVLIVCLENPRAGKVCSRAHAILGLHCG